MERRSKRYLPLQPESAAVVALEARETLNAGGAPFPGKGRDIAFRGTAQGSSWVASSLRKVNNNQASCETIEH